MTRFFSCSPGGTIQSGDLESGEPFSGGYDPIQRPSPPSDHAGNHQEDIAVIGLAFQFPQDATSPSSFWKLLVEGRSARTEVPKDRFNADSYYRAKGPKTGTIVSQHGHFLSEDLAKFDAPFFSISSQEAESMDPQQRFMLETSYHALENAGIPLEKIQNTKTSVHVGSFSHDFELMRQLDMELPATYTATGGASSILANRISWFYNLKGQSVTVDTACSSSLVALHLACETIRSGDAEMALAGGSNIICAPESSVGLSNLNVLSPEGKSYSFDSRANGYARGEGFAILVLKSVRKAIEDGDVIRAVIRGTGVNSDGRTPGITHPSSDAQRDLIRDTYSRNGLNMSKTTFVEAHGTGTPVGDPLEAKAIASAFSGERSKDQPLYVGAVKSNIGHLEGTAGLAGIIKTILVLEKGIMPPNTWFKDVNPEINTSELNLAFPSQPTPWPADGLRRASVNSFGFGGTNAHAILDDAYHYLKEHQLQAKHATAVRETGYSEPRRDSGQGTPTDNGTCRKLLVFSSADENGLERMASAYSKHLLTPTDTVDHTESSSFVSDLAYTLSNCRTQFSWRAHSICDPKATLCDLALSKPVRCGPVPKVCFIFTGQGAQWQGMGQALMKHTVFRRSIEQSEQILRCMNCHWSLCAKLYGSETARQDLDCPEFSQPLTTALQVALVDLLDSWGVEPVAVVGHSSGEIGAAFCAKRISRESAIQLAYYRGLSVAESQFLSRFPPTNPGAMMAVRMSAEECQSLLAERSAFGPSDILIACYNSPRNLTLSGSELELEALRETLEKRGVMAKRLRVNVAYHHSERMEEASEIFGALSPRIEPHPHAHDGTQPIMISSLTGAQVYQDLTSKNYWQHNLLSPVRFSDGVSALLRTCSFGTSDIHFIEVGPHSTLESAVKETLQSVQLESKYCYSSALSRGHDAEQTALNLAGSLYCAGYPIDIASVNGRQGSQLVDLPSYPFNHSKRYWLESRVSKNQRMREFPHHDYLGTRTADWNSLEAKWNNRIILDEKKFIRHHKVNGANVYPAAGMLVMALEAALQLEDFEHRPTGYQFLDVSFQKALVVPNTRAGVETQFFMRRDTHLSSHLATWYEFRLCAFENNEWFQCCRGGLKVEKDIRDRRAGEGLGVGPAQRGHIVASYERAAELCKTPVEEQGMYKFLHRIGLDFGSMFQSLENIRCDNGGQSVAELDPSKWSHHEDASDHSCFVHPSALDSIFQVSFPAITNGCKKPIATLVPTEMRRLWIAGNLHITSGEESKLDLDIAAKSSVHGLRNYAVEYNAIRRADGVPCITGEMTFTAIGEVVDPVEKQGSLQFYNMDWKPDIDLLDNEQLELVCSPDKSFVPPKKESMNRKELACYIAISHTIKAIDEGRLIVQPTADHLHKYVQWMRHELELLGPRQVLISDSILDHGITLGDTAQSDAEWKLINKVSTSLTRILQGETDPLQFLFEDDLLERFYSIGDDAIAGIRAYVDLMAHKNPALRVLEVGAGTGGTTRYMLSVLDKSQDGGPQRLSEYAFTDISPGFFGPAGQKFTSDRLVWKTLDIGQDPTTQGFAIESYDLVIASNVLHATHNMASTLQNVRKTLKPGGKVILFETTNLDLVAPTFVFGLLPGWWLATEPSREWTPLMSVRGWDTTLRENGFTGTDIVVFAKDEVEDVYPASFMISTAQEKTLPSEQGHPVQSVSIICSPYSEVEMELAKSLKQDMERSTAGTKYRIEIHGPEYPDFVQTHAVCLLGLETMSLEHLARSDLEVLQKIISTTESLLWATEGGSSTNRNLCQEATAGFSRSIRTEHPEYRFATIQLESLGNISQSTAQLSKVLQRSLATNASCEEYFEKYQMLHINRVVQAPYLAEQIIPRTDQTTRQDILGQTSHDALALSMQSVGLLNTLRFSEDLTYKPRLGDEEIEIETKAIGINFKDILISLGQVPSTCLGAECSGIVTKVGSKVQHLFTPGDRVLAATPNHGSFKTRVQCEAFVAHKIPDSMSYVNAAGLPVACLTAYYSLVEWGRLRKGESVLIHSGAGGLGQAAIQLAQAIGAEIFTTVGNQEKRQLLEDLYGIPDSHIMSSRSNDFVHVINNMTNGRGVDVILNSLAGEGLRSSWECIAPFGRFIEAGKRDILSSETTSHGGLPMFPFSKNVMFASVDMAVVVRDETKARSLLAEVMELVADGRFRSPQPLHVFKASQVEESFRFMQSGQSSGKLVVEMCNGDPIMVLPGPYRQRRFDSEASYLLAGGLGGIGRSIAEWMVGLGVRNLILLSRSGGESESARPFLDKLRVKGVNIFSPSCDVGDVEAVKTTLDIASKTMPPIKGCVQACLVLKSAMFRNMTLDQWDDTIKPKIQGSWNLHELLPKDLDFFIMLSSIAGVLGSAGQSNYAFGSAYQDALARHRNAIGQKGVSIDLGLVGSVGYVADRPDIMRLFQGSSYEVIEEATLLSMMEYYCNPSLAISNPDQSQALVGIMPPAETRSRGAVEVGFLSRPLFRQLHQIKEQTEASTGNGPEKGAIDWKSRLADSPTIEKARGVACAAISARLSEILVIDKEDIDALKPLHIHGVDSLVAIEMKNWFSKILGAEVPVFEILSNMSLEALANGAVERSSFVSFLAGTETRQG
ncbi:hypothetical protein BCR34DRAFT_603445 [Clohesyomyces aquaticus]|uniref:Uncharacterized protein n=1 Tax=Clohesyomyces aquaticus TaxID=1231657 RepID=A0A1Y1ZFG3_9PLEO|nr:hypothetical protein BCR34DRAFT_603445 [Clohesyomyces aquaticus]